MNVDQWRDRIQLQRQKYRKFRQHWKNDSPAAWLSKDSQKALNNKLSKVSVNWPRLVVQSISERLKIRGFRQRGENDLDNDLTRLLDTANIIALQELTHNDYLLYGAAFGTAWTASDGRPIYISDSPMTAGATVDPATREVTEAARSWVDGDGYANLVIMTNETMTRYKAKQQGTIDMVGHWLPVESWENELGVVPTVPFFRQDSSDDINGSSVVADILELTDANSKALGDAMVTSEYFAKPRRWATGLEIEEDKDGKPIDPFGESRLLQSEDPDTKFGQLNASTPSGQTELIATLTQQIGALTGLPPHYLGLHGDQPPSADGVRASETQLVSKAYKEQSGLSAPWVQVIGRLKAVQDKMAYEPLSANTMWEPAETKTPAQAADAAQKLRAIGVPLESLLSNPLDYEAHEIREIVQQADSEAAREALNNMGRSI